MNPLRFSACALALAAPRANAVGAVRIDLGPDAIAIELRRVASFRAGFAPGSLADPVELHVPYSAVRGLVEEHRLLYLTFDPSRVTPFNRFALAGFSPSTASAAVSDDMIARSFQMREEARWLSRLLPLPLGAIVAWVAPDALVAGALGRASVGALVAMSVFLVLREIATRVALDGPESESLRRRFEAELASRLSLLSAPAVVRVPPPVLAARLPPRRRPLKLEPSLVRAESSAREAITTRPEPERISRGTVAAAVALVVATAAVVGTLGFMANRARPASTPEVDRAVSGIGAIARGLHATSAPVVEAERCLCVRADSNLWKDGIDRLGLLTFHGEDEASAPLVPTVDSRGASRYDFDLAIVNDGARPMRDVRITLTFARRTAAGKRVGAVDRGLFWEGALAPGASVKWRVKAPGSEVRVDTSITGTLDQAAMGPAPGDAFFKLMSSHFRAVRVHAAMMLAYLRDPRAESAVRSLQGSASDAALIDAIRRAAAPVIACDVQRQAGRADACVFNASSRSKRRLSLREARGADDVRADRSVPIEVEVPVHEGRRISLELPSDAGGELEVVDPE